MNGSAADYNPPARYFNHVPPHRPTRYANVNVIFYRARAMVVTAYIRSQRPYIRVGLSGATSE